MFPFGAKYAATTTTTRRAPSGKQSDGMKPKSDPAAKAKEKEQVQSPLSSSASTIAGAQRFLFDVERWSKCFVLYRQLCSEIRSGSNEANVQNKDTFKMIAPARSSLQIIAVKRSENRRKRIPLGWHAPPKEEDAWVLEESARLVAMLCSCERLNSHLGTLTTEQIHAATGSVLVRCLERLTALGTPTAPPVVHLLLKALEDRLPELFLDELLLLIKTVSVSPGGFDLAIFALRFLADQSSALRLRQQVALLEYVVHLPISQPSVLAIFVAGVFTNLKGKKEVDPNLRRRAVNVLVDLESFGLLIEPHRRLVAELMGDPTLASHSSSADEQVFAGNRLINRAYATMLLRRGDDGDISRSTNSRRRLRLAALSAISRSAHTELPLLAARKEFLGPLSSNDRLQLLVERGLVLSKDMLFTDSDRFWSSAPVWWPVFRSRVERRVLDERRLRRELRRVSLHIAPRSILVLSRVGLDGPFGVSWRVLLARRALRLRFESLSAELASSLLRELPAWEIMLSLLLQAENTSSSFQKQLIEIIEEKDAVVRQSSKEVCNSSDDLAIIVLCDVCDNHRVVVTPFAMSLALTLLPEYLSRRDSIKVQRWAQQYQTIENKEIASLVTALLEKIHSNFHFGLRDMLTSTAKRISYSSMGVSSHKAIAMTFMSMGARRTDILNLLFHPLQAHYWTADRLGVISAIAKPSRGAQTEDDEVLHEEKDRKLFELMVHFHAAVDLEFDLSMLSPKLSGDSVLGAARTVKFLKYPVSAEVEQRINLLECASSQTLQDFEALDLEGIAADVLDRFAESTSASSFGGEDNHRHPAPKVDLPTLLTRSSTTLDTKTVVDLVKYLYRTLSVAERTVHFFALRGLIGETFGFSSSELIATLNEASIAPDVASLLTSPDVAVAPVASALLPLLRGDRLDHIPATVRHAAHNTIASCLLCNAAAEQNHRLAVDLFRHSIHSLRRVSSTANENEGSEPSEAVRQSTTLDDAVVDYFKKASKSLHWMEALALADGYPGTLPRGALNALVVKCTTSLVPVPTSLREALKRSQQRKE